MGLKKLSPDSIYHEIFYLKTMLITGFLKSTIGTGFISVGITIIAMGLATPNYNDNSIYVGLVFLFLGCLIYFAGDIYRIEQKKEEIKIIDKRIDEVEKKTEKTIQSEVEQLVNQIIESAEEKKRKDIQDKIRELELGLCGDIANLKPKNSDELTYCGHALESWQDILAYPDAYPSIDIINIARLKLSMSGKKVDHESLANNIKTLYYYGLISKVKYDECLKLLKEYTND